MNSLANREECCVCEFQHLGLSQPTISHHLKILREAGLIEVARKRGTWTFYRLVPAAVESLAFALGGSAKPEMVLATAGIRRALGGSDEMDLSRRAALLARGGVLSRPNAEKHWLPASLPRNDHRTRRRADAATASS